MSQPQRENQMPKWISAALTLAGIYNLAWGGWVILSPAAIFQWAGMELPRYPQIWQCVGMIVGVYGIGYLIAAGNPFRYWPIVLVGLLGKIFGPIGFAVAWWNGEFPTSWAITILTNDLIWWIPFGAALYHAFRIDSLPEQQDGDNNFDRAIREIRSHRGASLYELSLSKPTLVVFLRHAGCTFCREALTELGKHREALENQGVELAIVHMSEPLNGTLMSSRYGLSGIHRFSDPSCMLYRSFGLERGRLWQLFGPIVWWRGFFAGVVKGHGIGKLEGDGFQMPGVFLLSRGRVVEGYQATTAADRPDYLAIACTPSQTQPFGIASESRVAAGP